MRRLLVIAPHADDAELGCGGYMAQFEGRTHVAVVATRDIFFSHLNRTVKAEERVQELYASLRVLDATSEVYFAQHDTLLDTVPLKQIISCIENTIRVWKPTEVLIPLPSSHQDHDVVYRACLAALRPSSFSKNIEMVAAYEYAATSWGAGSSYDAGRGGLYVELDDRALDMKIAALQCYVTQIREGGHPWSVEAAKAMAKMRGLEAGVPYAELFHVMRQIRRIK